MMPKLIYNALISVLNIVLNIVLTIVLCMIFLNSDFKIMKPGTCTLNIYGRPRWYKMVINYCTTDEFQDSWLSYYYS